MRTSVWWVKPKIGFLMEPYRGFPHVKASVYDCPSNGGRVVYEYMRCSSRSNRIFSSNAQACSTTMANDAHLAGSVLPEVRTFSLFALCSLLCPCLPHATRAQPRRRSVPCSVFLVLIYASVLAVAWRCRSLGCRPHPPRVRACCVSLNAALFTLRLSFFVEVFNFDPAAPNSPHFLSPSASYTAEFRISACVCVLLCHDVVSCFARRYIFDQSITTLDSFTPLQSLPRWDKSVRYSNCHSLCNKVCIHVDAAGSRKWRGRTACSPLGWTTLVLSLFRYGWRSCSTTVLHAALRPSESCGHSFLQWYLPGSNLQFSNPIVESDYEFQVYTLDITSYIGSSEQGVATALVIPARSHFSCLYALSTLYTDALFSVNDTAVCPSGAPCSTSNCRSCSEKCRAARSGV